MSGLLADPLRVENVITSGVFSLDGQDFAVENNVWLVGNSDEVLVIDAAHDAAAITAAVAGRRLVAVVCTHGHNDHIGAAGEVADTAAAATGGEVPILLHPDDDMLWRVVYPDRGYQPLADGQVLTVAGFDLEVLHTPGHSPGAVCLFAPELVVLFSGDTLFHGGPGATGRSYSSFATILESIRTRLLPLSGETMVLTGHGDTTTIAAEAADYEAWVARGH